MNFLLLDAFKMRIMLARNNPRFKWKACSKRADRHKFRSLHNHPGIPSQFLLNNVAINATLPEFVIFLGTLQFLFHPLGHNRQSDQLGMAMFQRSTSRLTMILKQQYITKPAIFFQILNSVTEGP